MRTGHHPQRTVPPPTVAGRRDRVPPPEPNEQREKGLSRRDLLVAGIGVATGVITTGATTFALDRLGPTVASSNLEALRRSTGRRTVRGCSSPTGRST
jgi:hypothetical protein